MRVPIGTRITFYSKKRLFYLGVIKKEYTFAPEKQ